MNISNNLRMTSREISFLKLNQTYLLKHRRPYDIDRGLLFPCDFVIIWKNDTLKPEFYSPCQITQSIGGIEIGTNTTPKYTKCFTSCPLCKYCGDLNKQRIYHQHGKTNDGLVLTLFRGGYEEYGTQNSTDIGTEIETSLLETILNYCNDGDPLLVTSLIQKIKKLKYFPFTGLKYMIDIIDEEERYKVKLMTQKYLKQLLEIKKLKISSIKSEIHEYLKTSPLDTPGYIIVEELLSWYKKLNSSYDKKYIWDIWELWDLDKKEFYQKLVHHNIPSNHYRAYCKDNGRYVPSMTKYPIHRDNLLTDIQVCKDIYNGLINKKLILIWILQKNIGPYLIRTIFRFFSPIEFLIN